MTSTDTATLGGSISTANGNYYFSATLRLFNINSGPKIISLLKQEPETEASAVATDVLIQIPHGRYKLLSSICSTILLL